MPADRRTLIVPAVTLTSRQRFPAAHPGEAEHMPQGGLLAVLSRPAQERGELGSAPARHLRRLRLPRGGRRRGVGRVPHQQPVFHRLAQDPADDRVQVADRAGRQPLPRFMIFAARAFQYPVVAGEPDPVELGQRDGSDRVRLDVKPPVLPVARPGLRPDPETLDYLGAVLAERLLAGLKELTPGAVGEDAAQRGPCLVRGYPSLAVQAFAQEYSLGATIGQRDHRVDPVPGTGLGLIQVDPAIAGTTALPSLAGHWSSPSV